MTILTTLRFNRSHRTVTMRDYNKKTGQLLAKYRSCPLSKEDFDSIYTSVQVSAEFFMKYFYPVYVNKKIILSL